MGKKSTNPFKELVATYRYYALAIKYFVNGWPWDQATEIAERLTDFKVTR